MLQRNNLFQRLVVLLLLSSCGQPARPENRSPYLNFVSETVDAGDVANVQGGGFTSNDRVMLEAIDQDGRPRAATLSSLQIVSRSYNLLQARIPANYPPGLWEVWVQNARDDRSNSRYIHQAHGVRFNIDAARVGAPLEVWGRNLRDPSGTQSSALLFVEKNQVVARASAKADSPFHLTLTTPSRLRPGVAYQVYVTNGLGGERGQTLVDAPLAIQPAGPDPLNLGVPWATHFTYLSAKWQSAPNTYNIQTDPRLKLHASGDGRTNDALSLQQAIDMASNDPHGGGIVYLPRGVYRLGPTGRNKIACLAMRTHVILMGDGAAESLLMPDADLLKPAMISNYLLFDYFNAKQCGMMNLGVKYVNDVFPGHRTFMGAGVGAYAAYNLFFKNVTIDLTNAQQMVLAGADHLLFDHCTLINLTGQVLQAIGARWALLQNSTFRYALGRMDMAGADDTIVRDCKYYREGRTSRPNSGETGGVEVSFAHTPVISGNTFVVTDGAQGGNNDGETVLLQDAAYSWYFRDAGTLTEPAGTQSLTDLNKDWSNVSLTQPGTNIQPGSAVKIMSGPALGQWRTIVSVNKHTLQLDRPWDSVPPAGSLYAIGPWGADRVFVLNNTFIDPVSSPIELYSGAWYCMIAGNRSTTSPQAAYRVPDHRIWLSATDAIYPPQRRGGPPTLMVNPVWESLVVDNVLVNANPNRSAEVLIEVRQVAGPLHGITVLNNELYDNEILSKLIDPNGAPAYMARDGFHIAGRNEGGPPGSVPGAMIVGTLIRNHRSLQTKTPVKIGPGVKQAIAKP